jgi:hypothetical protein
MKKYISFFGLLLCANAVQAQDIQDAFRYSQDNITGTARFRGMGGAFGALGGDFSSININPAGSSVYINNQVGFTLSSNAIKNDSDYFGKRATDKDRSTQINQAGGVFVFENVSETSNWKKLTLALNYENTNNFDNSTFTFGSNPTNSIDKYFLFYANANQNRGGILQGVLRDAKFEDLSYEDQQAVLGYQAYILSPIALPNVTPDYLNPNINSYNSAIPAGGNYFQQNEVVSSGYNGKFSFNASGLYKDKLYVGINLNSHFTEFRRSSRFFESNANPKNASPTRTVEKVWFNNDLFTYGNGFSLQLGLIYKPTNEARIGLAYESPTWYSLNDELSQNITTSGYGFEDKNIPDVNLYTDRNTFNPDTTIAFAPYQLKTPSKVTGSLGYIFAKKGLISLDYVLKNYASMSFGPDSDEILASVNKKIERDVKSTTSEIRLGAEYRIEQFSLRGGYRFEQSPYKDNTTIGNLTSVSGGLGYNFGGTRLDFAYTNSKRDYKEQFFNQGLTDASTINSKNNMVTVSLVFEL